MHCAEVAAARLVGTISKARKNGRAAFRNGLIPLDRPLVTLLGTAPGGHWNRFDWTLARVFAHALPVPSRREIRAKSGFASVLIYGPATVRCDP
jgi:hypothetical protein